jgi:DNA repair exonuclease SbcCD ATPase subunit
MSDIQDLIERKNQRIAELEQELSEYSQVHDEVQAELSAYVAAELEAQNAFLKANLKALFNKQVQHTQEMWELINEIFDRDDNNTPRER